MDEANADAVHLLCLFNDFGDFDAVECGGAKVIRFQNRWHRISETTTEGSFIVNACNELAFKYLASPLKRESENAGVKLLEPLGNKSFNRHIIPGRLEQSWATVKVEEILKQGPG